MKTKTVSLDQLKVGDKIVSIATANGVKFSGIDPKGEFVTGIAKQQPNRYYTRVFTDKSRWFVLAPADTIGIGVGEDKAKPEKRTASFTVTFDLTEGHSGPNGSDIALALMSFRDIRREFDDHHFTKITVEEKRA